MRTCKWAEIVWRYFKRNGRDWERDHGKFGTVVRAGLSTTSLACNDEGNNIRCIILLVCSLIYAIF
uniref:Uncharacterized protein n=1 Tax=Manihot esculenta TaxID=3983 RepID=A0A2C9VAS9_MANES